MRHNLFDHVNIDLANTNVPSGVNGDGECERYDKLIADFGGIDLQLLGLGVNGHIGFNEPADAFSTGTHQVTLTQSTRDANKRFFASIEEVPTHAYTMGVRDIMQAQRADGGLRCQQGPGHQGRLLRPRDPPGVRLHPPVPPRLHPGGRRGSPVSHLIFFIPFQKGSPSGCSLLSPPTL